MKLDQAGSGPQPVGEECKKIYEQFGKCPKLNQADFEEYKKIYEQFGKCPKLDQVDFEEYKKIHEQLGKCLKLDGRMVA